MPQGQLEFEGLVESEGRTSGNEMREPLLANRDPLCQVAKSKLLELGVEPDPDQLYPLQLMNWAAGHGLVVVRPGLAWRQQEVRQVLEGMEPEAALRFLTECGPEERIDDPEALAEMEPADAAAELFEMLHSRMAATLEDYPLPRSE